MSTTLTAQARSSQQCNEQHSGTKQQLFVPGSAQNEGRGGNMVSNVVVERSALMLRIWGPMFKSRPGNHRSPCFKTGLFSSRSVMFNSTKKKFTQSKHLTLRYATLATSMALHSVSSFVIFFSPSRQIPGQYLKLDLDSSVPYPSQFITH
jgi:hypothetical protein